ncbi:MAG: hypothetical protein GY816_22720, partial [Cytophagales bacterium]|nr:hypothetical protein [Cytophagales bacterium]
MNKDESKKSILVIDDAKHTRNQIRIELEDEFHIHEAENWAEAEAMISKN